MRRRADLTVVLRILAVLPWMLASGAIIWLLAGFLLGPAAVVAVVLWLLAGGLAFVPRVEHALAAWAFDVRPPTAAESETLAASWAAVCARASIDPRRFDLWVQESRDLSAFAVSGHIVSVTTAALATRPDHLQAILAHELGHHLSGHSWIGILELWYSLPAQAVLHLVTVVITRLAVVLMDLAAVVPVFALSVAAFILAALGFGGWLLWGAVTASWLLAVALSVLAVSPVVIAALGRRAEFAADLHAARLGYAAELTEVLQGWVEIGYDEAGKFGDLRAQVLSSHPTSAARILALRPVLVRSITQHAA